jgi:hypothetical protein
MDDLRRALPALALSLAGGVLTAFMFLHVMKAGSCTSDSLYATSHPCPPGTGWWTVGTIFCAFIAVFALLAGLAFAAFVASFAVLFLSMSAVVLTDALSRHALGGPHTVLDWTVTVIFFVLGAVPASLVLRRQWAQARTNSRARRSAPSPR